MKPSEYDVAQIIRSMINIEHRFINDRVGWMLTSQAFLFTALGFLLGKPNSIALLWLICVLGIAIAGIIASSVILATRAIYELADWWDEHKPKDYNGPAIAGKLTCRNMSLRSFLGPWNFLAYCFLLAWLFIVLTYLVPWKLELKILPFSFKITSPELNDLIKKPERSYSRALVGWCCCSFRIERERFRLARRSYLSRNTRW
jgi:hypothetical protein